MVLNMSWTEFIGGNSKAFESIYNQYVDDLFLYGQQFHKDKDQILDCIHDLFIDLFNNPRISRNVEVKFYLFSSLKRRLLKLKSAQLTSEISQIPDNLLWISSHELEMIKNEHQQVNLKLLKKKIDLLPKKQKEVIYLRYYMEFTYEEIATLINISVESCRTSSYRGIKELRKSLRPAEFLLLFLFIWQ